MKRLPILFLVTIASLSLVACTEDPSTDENASTDPYPLDTCVVSGEPLGSMGEPIVVEHEGTTVKLCCKECIEKFESDPDKYVAKLK